MIETCSADQHPVDLLLRQQALNVVRFHTASIENADIGAAEFFDGLSTDEAMRIGGNVRCRGTARADRPYRLVGNGDLSKLLRRELRDAMVELTFEHPMGLTRFALFEHLAHAHDRLEPGCECRNGPLVDQLIGLMKVLAALAVADNHPLRAGLLKHASAYLTGECAVLRFPMQVLAADRNVRVARRLDRRRKIHKRRAYHNVAIAHTGNRWYELL